MFREMRRKKQALSYEETENILKTRLTAFLQQTETTDRMPLRSIICMRTAAYIFTAQKAVISWTR